MVKGARCRDILFCVRRLWALGFHCWGVGVGALAEAKAISKSIRCPA